MKTLQFWILLVVESIGVFFATRGWSEEISFKDQIAPILTRRCLGCHSNQKTEGRYALHTFEELLKPGDSEELPIVPGNAQKSLLFQRLCAEDETLRMPQEDDPLTESQIQLIRRWIDAGAPFDGPNREERLVAIIPAEDHPAAPEIYRQPVPIFSLRFSPDGKTLLTAGVHEILCWNVANGKLLRRIGHLPQRIHSMRWSPDGKQLAVAGGTPGEYGEIRLIDWESQTQRAIARWEDVVLDVAFDREGRTLIAGAADNSLRAYDLKSSKLLWSNRQHVDWVTSIDVTNYSFVEELLPNEKAPDFFSFDENETKSGFHSQQLWKFRDGSMIVRKANWELETNLEKSHLLTKITVKGIGKTYEEKRELTDPGSLEFGRQLIDSLIDIGRDWSNHPSLTPFVITGSRDRTAKVFQLRTGALFTTYKGHRREYGPLKGMHRVFGVFVEPGTRTVWTGGEGQHFHGWNPVTVRDEDGTAADMEERFSKEYSIRVLRHDHAQPVLALMGTHRALFAATSEGHVGSYPIAGPEVINDVAKRAHSFAYVGHEDQLYAIDVHPEANLLAAAGFRGEVILWRVDKETPQLRFWGAPVHLDASLK